MNDLNLIKNDITDILKYKSMEKKYSVICIKNIIVIESFLGKDLKDAVTYTENIILIESFLGKGLNVLSSAACVLDLSEITQKDVLALREYLDYICMIKEN